MEPVFKHNVRATAIKPEKVQRILKYIQESMMQSEQYNFGRS